MIRLSLVVALTGMLSAGCSGRNDHPLPTTYRLTGKVVTAKGTPLTGGMVQFECPRDASFTVVGVIGPEGKYEAKTVRDRTESPGAPAGEYRVTVTLPLANGNASHAPITLPRPCAVLAQDTNTFDIQLPR